MKHRLWYGGDYNPEQWTPDVWDEDVRLMQRAGVTVATVAVFSWSRLEPSDGRFSFGWLDDVLDRLHAAGIRVDLATATASPPPWLVLKHPEMLPVTEDGVRLSGGSRQHYSPSSAVYRRYADRLVTAIAERYASHPALEAWHINNELACHVHRDYSDESAVKFRDWLEQRYGNIDALNDAWGTDFWSQVYGTFEEIMPPRTAPTFRNPTQLIDFDRFSSDAWLSVLRAEAKILHAIAPNVPITTNFMGFFKPSNYWQWAAELDFISDDHYADPADPLAPAYAAMTRDLMRSLGAGAPWVLMEQASSAVNWRRRNAAISSEMRRALTLQAIARGADGVMQFQWRQSRAGAEKFHSAMLPHAGERSRIFDDTVSLGQEIASLADVVGTRQQPSVSIVFDWDSWWAIEQTATPAELSYVDIVFRWYQEFWRQNILVDFTKPDGNLSSYSLVVAPGTLVLSEAAQHNLGDFVRNGGTLAVGYQTGVLDEHLRVPPEGYLGRLGSVLGISVEEFTPPAEPTMTGGPVPDLRIAGLAAGVAREWGEIVRTEGATVLTTFVGGMLNGLPAITRNEMGRSAAWYIATAPDELRAVVEALVDDAQIASPLESPEGVEVVQRGPFLFMLNHTDEEVLVLGRALEARDSVVVDTRRKSAPQSARSDLVGLGVSQSR